MDVYLLVCLPDREAQRISHMNINVMRVIKCIPTTLHKQREEWEMYMKELYASGHDPYAGYYPMLISRPPDVSVLETLPEREAVRPKW